MDFKFNCPHCGQHISASPEQIGIDAVCPGCGSSITVPSLVPPPLPSPAQKPNTKLSFKAKAILIMWCGFCLMFPIIIISTEIRDWIKRQHPSSVTEQTSTESSKTESPPIAVNEVTRNATRGAWNALNQAEFDTHSIQDIPEHYAKLSLLYSQIDLTNVDPDLCDLVRKWIDFFQRSHSLFLKIQGEIAEKNEDAETVTQIGELAGALLGNGQNPQRDATVGKIGAGLLAEAGRENDVQEIIKKYKQQGDQLADENKSLTVLEFFLAQKLTSKYQTQFSLVGFGGSQ